MCALTYFAWQNVLPSVAEALLHGVLKSPCVLPETQPSTTASTSAASKQQRHQQHSQGFTFSSWWQHKQHLNQQGGT